MDLLGISIGLILFATFFFIVFLLLSRYDLNQFNIIKLILLCAGGHLLGGFVYYQYALHVGTDSNYYFEMATTRFGGFSYHFAYFILGYLREYLVGDSLLAAFLTSAALGFIGSVIYFLTYKILLDKFSQNKNYYLIDQRILWFPGLVLLCWPSYFFWSSALVKDNFSFLSIGIILYCIAYGRFSIKTAILFFIGALAGFLVRPYLFIIFILAISCYVLLGSKLSLLAKIISLILIALAIKLAAPYVLSYFGDGPMFTYVTQFAIRQQQLLSIGSSIPMPTHNPNLMIFFLPYMILGNLCLPLFIGAHNIIGMISSLENICLIILIYHFYKNRMLWQEIKKKLPIVKFFMIYFLLGMSFLSMMNTNLGLAMREKMMYVPALLIVMMLVYAYRRMLIIDYYLNEIDK